ncbi:Hypothetical protein, putative [Bodo saltans]|uniref:Uncharacterized protein n=1 Tax=Bodo saltans TaxID=75058 RepID=A0A0S4J7G5_BODSA|nr:Hypothetical protein, putative [Bodo saltans]|eukprot:CUG87425.1 Hypothetical protein, putative [Bodo saltans]
MNTWRIQHHTIRVRGNKEVHEKAAAPVTNDSTTPQNSPDEALPLSASSVSRSPVEAAAAKPPTSSRPNTAPHRSRVVRSAGGRRVVETVLTPRESTFEDLLQPRAILHHCEGYRYCPPAVPEEPERLPLRNEPEVDPVALMERVKLSEQRVLSKRAPRRPATGTSDRLMPPRLQLLFTKIGGPQPHLPLLRRASQAQPHDDLQEVGFSDNEPLVAEESPESPSPITAVRHRTVSISSMGTTMLGDTANSSYRGHPCAEGATRAERAVHALVGSAQERLRDTLIHARSEAHRQQLRDELETLTRAEHHCHSALTSADLTTRRKRNEFQQALNIDEMSKEELDGRLLYGTYLKRIVSAEHRARHDALESRGVAARIAAANHTPEERATHAQQRRTLEMAVAHSHQLDAVDAWKRRAAERQTLNYHDRVAQTHQQEVNRCATYWASVVLLFAFPRRMVAQRAAILERLLLSRKRKDEHVAHFLKIMRRVLARCRHRMTNNKKCTLRCAVRWLMLFSSQRRRRNAVTEIVHWFQEYSRNKPATDMIAKFKRAIVKCQRLVRQWIHRRRLEECWTLLKLQQQSTAHHWRPLRPIMATAIRSTKADFRADVKRDIDVLVQKFSSEVIPPFSIRMDAICDTLRRQRQQYVVEMREYLRLCALEKKRVAKLQRQYVSPTRHGLECAQLPPRPCQRLFPHGEALQELQRTISTNYATSLRQRIDVAMKEHQQRSVSPGGTFDVSSKKWVPTAVMQSSTEALRLLHGDEALPEGTEHRRSLLLSQPNLDSSTALLNQSMSRSANRSMNRSSRQSAFLHPAASAPSNSHGAVTSPKTPIRHSTANGRLSQQPPGELNMREAAALYRRALSEI